MKHAREHKVKGANTSDAHFEMYEQDNERHKMANERSYQVPKSVVNDTTGVWDMKADAMDEAYGAAGRDMTDARKLKSQMMNYNW